MQKRFVTIWFRHLLTDWLAIKRPSLQNVPFVFAAKDGGKLLIIAANKLVETEGIVCGMAVADAKAIIPHLEVIDDIPGKATKLLIAIGGWCIRYTPIIAIDPPNGLILDVSGCAHLWAGERPYLKEIVTKLISKGYDVRAAMADTIGASWAICHFGKVTPIIGIGEHTTALLSLPPEALRLEPVVLQRLNKLGLTTIKSFINMPRSVLRRRFGENFLLRLCQAFGQEEEVITPLRPIQPYEARLPCLEPIRTVTGIEIAINTVLEILCERLKQEGKGLRTAILKCYRIDGKIIRVDIGTNRASHHIPHIFKLFQLKISSIEPDLGIELFMIQAPKVEDVDMVQEALWVAKTGLDDLNIIELLDRLAGKVGAEAIHRYLPDEHHWPERSIKLATSLQEKPTINWNIDRPRPTQLLAKPEIIEVTALIPDYPPMLFIYKGKRHHIKKADGPERIEREWWLDAGEHRDYYNVEDENGQRYWLFRSGHYEGRKPYQWFIHGFFA